MINNFDEYIKELQSSTPVPGGGSANGKVAQIAISLASMAINVSKAKKSYESFDDETKQNINTLSIKLQQWIAEAGILAEKDMEVFNSYMQASADEKGNALIQCYNVPKELQELCLNAANDITKVQYIIAKTILSDYKMSLQLLRSSLICGLYNMEINVNYIKNTEISNDYNVIREKTIDTIKYIDKTLGGDGHDF